MDKTTVNSLNRRMLQHLQAGSTDLAPAEGCIRAAAFTCPDVLGRERDILFRKSAQPVAFSGELPQPGSCLALDILDTPVLLIRDEERKLRAFINACAHRGMPLDPGSGNARGLVCPFHGWAYRLDGTLRGRPEEASFSTPPEALGLSPLPVAENAGIIVVGLDPQLAESAMQSALGELAGELASFGFENYRPLARRERSVDANWKLITDLSLESYHFRNLHRDSVAQVLTSNAVVDTFGRHSRWAFPLKTIETLAQQEEADWPDELQGSCTYTLFPGVMFLVNSLGAQMIRAEPGYAPGKSRVIYAGMARPDCDLEDARKAFDFGGDVFHKEDLPAAEACQRGIAASRRDLPLGRNEPLLQFWHQLWADALA